MPCCDVLGLGVGEPAGFALAGTERVAGVAAGLAGAVSTGAAVGIGKAGAGAGAGADAGAGAGVVAPGVAGAAVAVAAAGGAKTVPQLRC